MEEKCNLLELVQGRRSRCWNPRSKRSSFSFNIRLRPVSPDERKRSCAGKGPSFPGKRILVAEDNDLNMEIICTILKSTRLSPSRLPTARRLFRRHGTFRIWRAVGAFPDIRCKPRRNKHYTEHLRKGGQPVILAGILAGAFPFPDNVSGKVFQENIAEAAVDKTVKSPGTGTNIRSSGSCGRGHSRFPCRFCLRSSS